MESKEKEQEQKQDAKKDCNCDALKKAGDEIEKLKAENANLLKEQDVLFLLLDLTLSGVELWGQRNGLIDKETDPAEEFVKRHGKISSLLEQIPKMGIEELGNRFAEILGALENQEGERVEEMECVFHWLDCLYQDFRNKRTAGEQFPYSGDIWLHIRRYEEGFAE